MPPDNGDRLDDIVTRCLVDVGEVRGLAVGAGQVGVDDEPDVTIRQLANQATDDFDRRIVFGMGAENDLVIGPILFAERPQALVELRTVTENRFQHGDRRIPARHRIRAFAKAPGRPKCDQQIGEGAESEQHARNLRGRKDQEMHLSLVQLHIEGGIDRDRPMEKSGAC